MKERAVRGVHWREGPGDWQLVIEGIEALGEFHGAYNGIGMSVRACVG